jgi:hypothetical protein
MESRKSMGFLRMLRAEDVSRHMNPPSLGISIPVRILEEARVSP